MSEPAPDIPPGMCASCDLPSLLSQWGRFDLVSMLLAAIGLVLVVGGIFAFLNLRDIAKREATREAKEIAEGIAESAANAYIQRELPGIVRSYRTWMDQDGLGDDAASGISSAQSGEGYGEVFRAVEDPEQGER